MTRFAVSMVTLLVATTAVAEVSGESARHLLVEVKAGPFMPAIDRPFRVAGIPEADLPYQSVFGATPMLLGELEIDYEVFNKFGTVTLGLSGGYAERYVRRSVGQASESIGMRLVPIKIVAQYRFDYLLQKFQVPLVPYVKLAFVGTAWFVSKGKNLENVDGLPGQGVKFGLGGSLGLALNLDFLDPRLSRDFDTTMGVNHTFLFFEYTIQEVNNFKGSQSRDFDLSSQWPWSPRSAGHFMVGLGFEI